MQWTDDRHTHPIGLSGRRQMRQTRYPACNPCIQFGNVGSIGCIAYSPSPWRAAVPVPAASPRSIRRTDTRIAAARRACAFHQRADNFSGPRRHKTGNGQRVHHQHRAVTSRRAGGRIRCQPERRPATADPAAQFPTPQCNARPAPAAPPAGLRRGHARHRPSPEHRRPRERLINVHRNHPSASCCSTIAARCRTQPRRGGSATGTAAPRSRHPRRRSR